MAGAKANERDAALRRLPKIDELLARGDVAALAAELPRWALAQAARDLVDEQRRAILRASGAIAFNAAPTAAAIGARARQLRAPPLRRLINATGVVLHTNFGRAPLSAAALEAIAEIGRGYSNLEYDIDAGERGSRHGHLKELVRALAGAEDAVVVNNNAAATMLGVAALASGREVIVSRGELVEIGGSFRIPDVVRLSGATMVEVGTTNKTRIADYAAAITDKTALLLKVHRSNFAVVGFSEEVSSAELADLGQQRKLATMFDLGSGSLLSAAEMQRLGLPWEEGAADAVASGIDLVTFSGDKLLGGPQAGLLAGRAFAVEACRRHPLMRALRPGKLTLAALAATLGAYRDAGAGRAPSDIPAIAMLGADPALLRARADGLCARVAAVLTVGLGAEVTAVASAVGGGAMPLASLPSWGIALTGASAEVLAEKLRAAPVAVVGRIVSDTLVLDLRTIDEREEADLVAVLASIVG